MKQITTLFFLLSISIGLNAESTTWAPTKKLKPNLEQCIEALQKGFIVEREKVRDELIMYEVLYDEKRFWIRYYNVRLWFSCDVSQLEEIDVQKLLSQEYKSYYQ